MNYLFILKNQIFLIFCLFFSLPSACFFPFFSPLVKPERPITIMIEPAGDANHTGRKIDDNFERGITLQCAQELKQLLEETNSTIRVVLTRNSGEVVQPLQNANFANRLNVDFYLSLNFYQEHETKPALYIYNFSYNDDFVSKPSDLCFCPYDKAHLYNYRQTREFGMFIKNVFQTEEHKKIVECKGLFKLPFKPLIGIKSSAIALEIGLHTKDDWKHYMQPLVESVTIIIEKLRAAQSI